LFFVLILGFAIRAQRRKPVTGVEGLLGETGIVTVDLEPEGKIRVHGEIWSASSGSDIPSGTKVRVTAVEGMELRVEEVQKSEIRNQKSDERLDSDPDSDPDSNPDSDTNIDTEGES
jgi:membrane-bound serine protease (ClpP class)